MSIKLCKEPLKIEPSVGFLETPSLRAPEVAVEADVVDTMEARPGSGITDDLLELTLPESEALLGLAGSDGLVLARAASNTSFKNGFFVLARRLRCSSGTVSRFFSKKPSASYVTSMA